MASKNNSINCLKGLLPIDLAITGNYKIKQHNNYFINNNSYVHCRFMVDMNIIYNTISAVMRNNISLLLNQTKTGSRPSYVKFLVSIIN